MTTTENTPTGRVDTPVMGFKNPTNWAIAAVAGPTIAAVLVFGLTFIPVEALYTTVAAVVLWLLVVGVRVWKNRASSEDEQDAEPVMEAADVG
jgi:Flp pilus assembly protein TadB